MKIIWDQVTRVSQIVAVVLFISVFLAGFLIGSTFEKEKILGAPKNIINLSCDDAKDISVKVYQNNLALSLAGSEKYLTQVIPSHGVRYINEDESLIFWTEGGRAFLEQEGKIVLNNCKI